MVQAGVYSATQPNAVKAAQQHRRATVTKKINRLTINDFMTKTQVPL